MREPAFTPGPWGVNKYGSIGAGEFFKEPIVAMTEPLFDDPDRWAANNSLIAAAPALYEAARVAEQLALIASDWNLDEVEIDGEMRDIYDIRDIFKAALSLALGESPNA